MSKNKRFEPPMGWVVAINHQQVSVTRVAQELKADPVLLGQALERAGYYLTPDFFDISADTWKVLQKEVEKANERQNLRVVKESSDDQTDNG